MDTELTDDQWEVIRPLIPAQGRMGRPRADDRQVLNGILHVLKSGCRWKDLPRQFSHPPLLVEVEKMGRAGGMGQHLPGFAHDCG